MNLRKSASAAILLALAMGSAGAVTTSLSVTATVANAVEFNFDSGGTHYDQWVLSLDPFTSFAITQGDVINATVALDASHTIPAAVSQMSFLLVLQGNVPSGDNTGSSGTMEFSLGGTALGPKD